MIILSIAFIFADVISTNSDREINETVNFFAEAFVFVERGKTFKKVRVRWRPIKVPNLSKNDLVQISKINYISAFCSISHNNHLTRCKIAESTVETEKAGNVYNKILRSIVVNSCGTASCSEVKVAVRLNLSDSRATGKPTNQCVAPFCMPGPQLPMPPTNPKLGFF